MSPPPSCSTNKPCPRVPACSVETALLSRHTMAEVVLVPQTLGTFLHWKNVWLEKGKQNRYLQNTSALDTNISFLIASSSPTIEKKTCLCAHPKRHDGFSVWILWMHTTENLEQLAQVDIRTDAKQFLYNSVSASKKKRCLTFILSYLTGDHGHLPIISWPGPSWSFSWLKFPHQSRRLSYRMPVHKELFYAFTDL